MILLTLAMLLTGVAAYAVDDMNMGTWKLNEAKSKFAPGSPKNHTVVYEMAGESIKVIVDGVDGAGNPTHNEWTGKFDGKYYAVTGDPTVDMRAYWKKNDHTMTLENQKAGKTVVTGKIVVAKDGKSRTLTTTAWDSKGKKIKSTAVYDKQ
jgi:hypothetical protein